MTKFLSSATRFVNVGSELPLPGKSQTFINRLFHSVACPKGQKHFKQGLRREFSSTGSDNRKHLLSITFTSAFHRDVKVFGSVCDDVRGKSARNNDVTSKSAIYSVRELSTSSSKIEDSRGSLIFQRTMRLDDAPQGLGLVSASAMLNMLDEAATRITSEHCNRNSTGAHLTPFLVGIESVEFRQSLLLGELAEVYGSVTYTSRHSMQVVLDVVAGKPIGGEKRTVCRSKLWYVAMNSDEDYTLTQVPSLIAPNEKAFREGGVSYKEMQKLRKIIAAQPHRDYSIHEENKPGHAKFSEVSSTTIVEPSQCLPGQTNIEGGSLLRIMENMGALSASTHTRYPAFAASVDGGVFWKQFPHRTALAVTARPVLATPYTLHVKISVVLWTLDYGDRVHKHPAGELFVTYVFFDEHYKKKPVPPLMIEMEMDKDLQAERMRHYMRRKQISPNRLAN